jgi:predicted DsbA family dithiol-disulfide isomerase
MKLKALLQIDFVSDVACPWCAIGLHSLEEALRRAADVLQAEITFQPFELNPGMAAVGENMAEHIARKYGTTSQQAAASREMVRSRAAEVGFAFNASDRSRVYNTFDAHRLLHWAQIVGRQRELKHALFKANFTDDANVSDVNVLAEVAAGAGLDAREAADVLHSTRYADEVRTAEQAWLSRGIHSVPGIVINSKWLLSGGQPPGTFEQTLRAIAEELQQAPA